MIKTIAASFAVVCFFILAAIYIPLFIFTWDRVQTREACSVVSPDFKSYAMCVNEDFVEAEKLDLKKWLETKLERNYGNDFLLEDELGAE